MRKQLRHQIRQKRNQLTPEQQNQAASRVAEQAIQFINTYQIDNIAIYLAFDGELSTEPLIKQLWDMQKKVYLPVLHPFSTGHLLFIRYLPQTPMQYNKFGILEPQLDVRNLLPLQYMQIIFTPLVAFDHSGNRLGMGGGFYDRTLQNWQQQEFLPIGLAHSCQQVESLPMESWDQPLAKIIVG